jgi:fatty-acyl-CoA synthase
MRLQPGVEARIRDELGQDCATGVVGEIQVRGWNVMRGYFDKPVETAAVLSEDGWLATGDLGRIDSDGRLEFTGRAKDLIRVGGENVSPAEIEDLLQQHPKVRQAQVVAVPHARLIEVPAAFVIARQGCDCSVDELLQWCQARLAAFKVPRHLQVVADFESIGMTASAKVRKADLREHAIRTFGLEA